MLRKLRLAVAFAMPTIFECVQRVEKISLGNHRLSLQFRFALDLLLQPPRGD